MNIYKSYKLIQFLNRRHSFFLRYTLGSSAWIISILLLRSQSLARLLFKEFVNDDFRLAFRRTAWLSQHYNPTIKLFNDQFFDFTMGTSKEHRQHLSRLIDRTHSSRDKTTYLTDKLYIIAADIHEELEKEQSEQTKNKIKMFYNIADEVLSLISIKTITEKKTTPERKDDFSIEHAIQALQDFSVSLPIDKWPWYVVSGTFLGLYRDGGFLAHDYDIDVGINAEDILVPELVNIFENHPTFTTKKIDEHIEIIKTMDGQLKLSRIPALIKLVHKNGLNLDVFIHHTTNGKTWHGSIIHRWENTSFELVRRNLAGVEVNTPKNADLYLTENYGDWSKPVKDFDCTTGTPNLVVSQNFLSIVLFLKRLVNYSKTDNHQAESLKTVLINSNIIKNKDNKLNIVETFYL